MPIKLCNKIILSCSNSKNEAESSANHIDLDANDKIKVFGFEHVIAGISDICWIESICKVLQPILSPAQTSLDQCFIHKISLISSPAFFYDSHSFLKILSTKHVLFSHLFPRNKQRANDIWPHFMANGQIDIFQHVGITSASFQKSVTVFGKYIQQQIYWLSVTSKKCADYRFFFKHIIVNTHLWTFHEIKKNRKKFETNIKHAVAQKHNIRMIIYFCFKSLIFEANIIWYFYFRDVKSLTPGSARSKRVSDMNEVKQTSFGKWTAFSVESHFSSYHGFFISFSNQEQFQDVHVFSDFNKHLESHINEDTFGSSFAEWQLIDWKQIIKALDNMQYGKCIAYLHRLATLVDAINIDQGDIESKKGKEFREKVLHETRLTLYGQGQLFQGFMNCIQAMMEVLKIFFRELKEYEGDLTESQRKNMVQDVDNRLVGEYMHKSIVSIYDRFKEICDIHYPLFSEYLHCIPRIKYILSEATQILQSRTDLSKMMMTNARLLCNEHLIELQQTFDLIGDALIRDELFMCKSTREWIQQKRDYFNAPPPNLVYTPSNNVLIIKDAINFNLVKRKLPRSILTQGTLLQYVVDTEMDKWFESTLFRVLSDSLVFNPWIKIVLEGQYNSFQCDSYKQSDTQIYEQIANLEKINVIDDNFEDIQHLYEYKGLYGYKSALSFIDADELKLIYREICSQIPKEIMMTNPLQQNKRNNDSHQIFYSFCGDISHYPYFDIALDKVEMIQNVFISGSAFDESVETFASHCWNLSHHLLKSPSASKIVFLSLNVGNAKKYQCDFIARKNNYQYTAKTLIQAAQSRQSICMELMVTSPVLKKYVMVTLEVFLIYHQLQSNRYRLCWSFRADVIFTAIFFEIKDAIMFWRAYSVGNIESEYNLEHKDYKKELLNQLQFFEDSAEFDAYFHCALRYKALNGECDGIVEIYRFFEESTLCGKCIESVQQLRLTKTMLDNRDSSRYIKNQMNRAVVSRQIKESVIYSSKIVFSDLLTFFDRCMLIYLQSYYKLYNAVDADVNSVLKQMIKVLRPLKNASSVAWSSWLINKNKSILVHRS